MPQTLLKFWYQTVKWPIVMTLERNREIEMVPQKKWPQTKCVKLKHWVLGPTASIFSAHLK